MIFNVFFETIGSYMSTAAQLKVSEPRYLEDYDIFLNSHF